MFRGTSQTRNALFGFHLNLQGSKSCAYLLSKARGGSQTGRRAIGDDHQTKGFRHGEETEGRDPHKQGHSKAARVSLEPILGLAGIFLWPDLHIFMAVPFRAMVQADMAAP